ncbi:sn-glycerol-3-phosphate ABC transporter ATP-binding protein UgpC [Halobaculum sp. WSA2]|uniref:ABC-type D-xylose/L-arabinose transporter n=1 Tax=Halobaculum saliterrae TaxID=2073113 RepID=A0A6B0T2Q6_9EURY|nr:ABC transporter ATP-binding protein [Halobaculum saliterrae]MXR40819.1 sn-glycerol-3-phosphate ABC transporter ATP-binding protein UgpC [Halobaculum saliterrae]
MTGISLHNLTKQFDDVTAVDSVSLDVTEGEFLVLVGPSGCGKSTTLRLCAGLESTTEGTVSISDRNVTAEPASERDVAMVFQNYALYPHMTARENMTFGLDAAAGFSGTEATERVEEAAAILDIEDLLDRKPSALSGGEQQRVAIGRALVRDPEVFLMDEPLSNLDAKLRVQMRAELAELHAELQTTTVYVTHDQVEAMTLGDRVAVMNDGRIEQVAPPQDLYDAPDTRFVAEFIGSPGMNTVDATLRRRGTVSEIVWGDNTVPLDASPESLGLTSGDRVVFGVRPEDLSADTDGDVRMEVTVTEPLGSTLLVRGTVGGHEMEVSIQPRSLVEVGDQITLGVDPDRLHLFDPESGAAVYHSADSREAIGVDGDGRRDAAVARQGGADD